MKVDLTNVTKISRIGNVRIDLISPKTTPKEALEVWSKKVTKQRKQIEANEDVISIICVDEKQRDELFHKYAEKFN